MKWLCTARFVFVKNLVLGVNKSVELNWIIQKTLEKPKQTIDTNNSHELFIFLQSGPYLIVQTKYYTVGLWILTIN